MNAEEALTELITDYSKHWGWLLQKVADSGDATGNANRRHATQPTNPTFR